MYTCILRALTAAYIVASERAPSDRGFTVNFTKDCEGDQCYEQGVSIKWPKHGQALESTLKPHHHGVEKNLSADVANLSTVDNLDLPTTENVQGTSALDSRLAKLRKAENLRKAEKSGHHVAHGDAALILIAEHRKVDGDSKLQPHEPGPAQPALPNGAKCPKGQRWAEEAGKIGGNCERDCGDNAKSFDPDGDGNCECSEGYYCYDHRVVEEMSELGKELGKDARDKVMDIVKEDQKDMQPGCSMHEHGSKHPGKSNMRFDIGCIHCKCQVKGAGAHSTSAFSMLLLMAALVFQSGLL